MNNKSDEILNHLSTSKNIFDLIQYQKEINILDDILNNYTRDMAITVIGTMVKKYGLKLETIANILRNGKNVVGSNIFDEKSDEDIKDDLIYLKFCIKIIAFDEEIK